MELKIYKQDGGVRKVVSPSDSSVITDEVGGVCSVSLNFEDFEFCAIEVNDYIEVDGVRYKNNAAYRPKMKNRQTYSYALTFFAPIHEAERILMKTEQNGKLESEFLFWGGPREHLQKWVDNMNRAAGSAVWTIGSVIASDNKNIEYRNVSCWDAAFGSNGIAATFGTEMWADGYVVNLCKCERGERVTLGYNNGLTSLLPENNSDKVRFFTRLFPLGSTRNINVSEYGSARLQLPSKAKYIDRNTDRFGIIEATEEAAFADIYPCYMGTVSKVRSESKTDENGKQFTVYYIKDDKLTWTPEALPGQSFMLSFQSGDLQGYGDNQNKSFQANWHDDTKEWEIINQWIDEQTQIPGGNIVPEEGNTYFPWNMIMPKEYITEAEKRLETAVNDYMASYSVEPVSYKGNTDYIHCDRVHVPLVIGQNVRLESDLYFAEGHLDTRITKVTRKLCRPSDASVTFADKTGAGWKKSVDNQLSSLHYELQKQSEQPGIDIIKTADSKTPSDNNVFSALRSLATFLRKDRADVMPYLLTLLQGVSFKGDKGISGEGVAKLLSAIFGNGAASINADGASTFKSATVREGVTSDNFSAGALGSGFVLKKDENNDSYLEVDRIMVRKVAIFVELLIQRLRHVGGQIILSPASMACERVEDRADAYRCYFRSTDGSKTIANEFVVGDQARCQTYNIKPGVHQGVQNQYYWRLVTAVGDDYIDLSKTDCDRGSTAPQAGDDIVQLGHRSDVTRQGAIVLAAHGAGAPYLKMYRNINSYVMDGREIIILSREEVSIIANKLQFSTGVSVETAINTAQNTANSASGKADKAQGAADKAQGAADSASKKADSAQKTADEAKTQASTTNQGLTDFIRETRGSFSSTNDRFNSVLNESKIYTNDQIGKIPYSGRNLLQMWSVVPGYLSPIDGSPIPTGTADSFDQLYDYIPVQPNEQLTLSLQGNIENKPSYVLGRFWIYNSAKVAIKQEIDWGIDWVSPNSATFAMPSDAAYVRCSLIRGNVKGLWKLERGTKVTDWTPAPEDTAALIEQNASEIKQLPDSITFSVSKKITGGALNYVSGTQGVIEVIGSGGPNETFARYTIHKEASGKTVGGAWKVRFEGCEFGANAQCTIKVSGNEWWWADFNVCYPTENKEYYIFKQHTDLPEVQNDALVQIQLDNIKGKVYVYEFRVFETATDEKGNYPISPLPWYPSRWDTEVLNSKITQTAEQISLKVERQIGGENLLYNSSFASDLVGWGIEGGSANMTAKIVNKDKTVDWLQGFPCLELWFNMASKGIYRYFLNPGIEGEGDAFTVSFDMLKRNPWPYQLIIGIEDSPQRYVDISNHPINEWKRVTVTQHVSRIGSRAILVYGGEGDGGVVYIKNMKVERGSVATPWCPAPSEQHDKLLATGIDIMNEKIVLTANNTVIQSNSGQQIAMFTEVNGKPLLKAENIDTDNLTANSLSSYNSSTKTSIQINKKTPGVLIWKTFDNYVQKAEYKVYLESKTNQSEEYYYPSIKTNGIAFDYPTTTVVENEQAFHGITFNKFPYTEPDTIRNKSHISPDYIALGKYRSNSFASAIRISSAGIALLKANGLYYIPPTEAVDIGGRKLFFICGIYVGSGQDWSDVSNSFVKDDDFFSNSISVL